MVYPAGVRPPGPAAREEGDEGRRQAGGRLAAPQSEGVGRPVPLLPKALQREGGEGGPLNRGAVGEGVAEGKTQLDRVGAAVEQGTDDRHGRFDGGEARGRVGDQTGAAFGAEAGRTSGPQVSLVTRSGTNDYDGSGYWFGRRTATSSNEYFLKLSQLRAGQESKAPKLDKDIFGGFLGGPIRRNKLFFFANYEGFKENSEQPVVRAVPSDSFRDGVIMYRCAVAGACPGGSFTCKCRSAG